MYIHTRCYNKPSVLQNLVCPHQITHNIYIHTCMYVCIYICTCTVCVGVCMYVYIYISPPRSHEPNKSLFVLCSAQMRLPKTLNLAALKPMQTPKPKPFLCTLTP